MSRKPTLLRRCRRSLIRGGPVRIGLRGPFVLVCLFGCCGGAVGRHCRTAWVRRVRRRGLRSPFRSVCRWSLRWHCRLSIWRRRRWRGRRLGGWRRRGSCRLLRQNGARGKHGEQRQLSCECLFTVHHVSSFKGTYWLRRMLERSTEIPLKR